MEMVLAQERAARLLALSKGVSRSKAAQLREIVDSVEVAIERGVTQAQLVRDLAQTGLEFTLGTFKTTLARIRRGRRAKAAASAPAAVAGSPASALSQAPGPTPGRDTVQPPAVELGASAAAHKSAQSGPTEASMPPAVPLPDDWLTAKLTAQQMEALSPRHRQQRVAALEKAAMEKYFPNRFKLHLQERQRAQQGGPPANGG